jgi:hypothetical protein
MATELAGYPLAFSTWIAQGGGLKSNRNGTMVYNSGPMKGMTRDQAAMTFQNRIWPNASDAWKNEYTRRATSGMMSPAETAQAAQPRTSVIPPRPAGASTNAANPPANPPATTTNRQPETVATPAPAPAASTATAATTVTPPKPRANQQEVASYIANQRPQVAGPKPISSGNSSDMLTNDDMSGKGYTLIGNKSGVKKWRKNDAMPGATPSTGSATEMPAMSVVAAPIPRGNQPFSTRFDINKGRVVATGGTPDASFERYDAAQERYKQGTQTKEDSAIVNDYIGQDALSRTPEQIAQDKAMDAARGRGGSNWQEMDAARRRASEAQQQQIADEKRAAATAKRNKEIERRMTAVAPPRMR